MENSAYLLAPSTDLSSDIAALEAAGFLLTMIYPADEPRVAQLTYHGVTLRLDNGFNTQATPAGSGSTAPTVVVPGLESALTTSAGASLVPDTTPWQVPSLESQYVFTSGGEWGQGRAGMQYRDLIPQRHGGRVIASHIRIPEPGPVPDYVHHHDIRFQMIYCRRGRVQVVYQDQGEPFWMEAGDIVLQPPHIRHRVLASDDGCEVVEIAAPAEHPTFIDTELSLPTVAIDPERDFHGQRFCFNRSADLSRQSVGNGWHELVGGFADATAGLANVRVLEPEPGAGALAGTSEGDLCLLYVLDGDAKISADGREQQVTVDDSVAVPVGHDWTLDEVTGNFRCLHVTLGDTGDTGDTGISPAAT